MPHPDPMRRVLYRIRHGECGVEVHLGKVRVPGRTRPKPQGSRGRANGSFAMSGSITTLQPMSKKLESGRMTMPKKLRPDVLAILLAHLDEQTDALRHVLGLHRRP